MLIRAPRQTSPYTNLSLGQINNFPQFFFFTLGLIRLELGIERWHRRPGGGRCAPLLGVSDPLPVCLTGDMQKPGDGGVTCETTGFDSVLGV